MPRDNLPLRSFLAALPLVLVTAVMVLPGLFAMRTGYERLTTALAHRDMATDRLQRLEELIALAPPIRTRVTELENAARRSELFHPSHDLASAQAAMEGGLRAALYTAGVSLLSLDCRSEGSEAGLNRLVFTVRLESGPDTLPDLLAALAAARPRLELRRLLTRQTVPPLPGGPPLSLTHELIIDAYVDIVKS